MTAALDYEAMVADDIGSFTHDPLAHVMYCYPWGEAGTVLENEDGPDDHQIETLKHIGEQLRAGKKIIRVAKKSGHGVGKSAEISWLVNWAMDTCRDARGVITANTETQLRTKTSPEIAKWRSLHIYPRPFDAQTFSVSSTQPGHKASWRTDLIPWSETNTEAFAGLHNAGKRIFLAFDEGSAITDKIWEVAEGAMTDADTEIIWVVYGNPTRNSGRFFQCWNKHRKLWHGVTVDSRTSKRTNKELIDQWAEIYGEESDFFRIRVRGEFPAVGDRQLIGTDLVDMAVRREVEAVLEEPIIMGVDPARFGDDRAVIYIRHGRDAASFPITKLARCDHETLAGKVNELRKQHLVDHIVVDGGGIGGPLCDTLRSFGIPSVHEVLSNNKPINEHDFLQRDAEMWQNLRDALREWLSIPDDDELRADLIGREYDYRRNKLVLERKEDMKKRGLDSPDIADALALTFAIPFEKIRRDHLGQMSGLDSDADRYTLDYAGA